MDGARHTGDSREVWRDQAASTGARGAEGGEAVAGGEVVAGGEAAGAGQRPPVGLESPYRELLEELDRSVQEIRRAALKLKAAAGAIQAVERNADRILASTRMLELNVSDLLGRPRSLASWAEDDRAL